jgi:carbon-monoxide dehydrogenase medium subunit
MKASAFAYARATSVANALELLAANGEKAKVLSGGQSLLPAMNLRVTSPELLIDIGGLAELRGIRAKGDYLCIGALTRHVELLRSAEIAAQVPLLAEATAHVGHPAIRNRGTIGGSLAHADPASELPACMLALDAAMVIRNRSGERRIAARDFFRGIYETALTSADLLIAIELPVPGKNSRHFFAEFARRHGDYAIAGVAAQATVENGLFRTLRLAFFAVEDRPKLAGMASRLVEVPVTRQLLSDASDALRQELDPPADQQASGAMRRHLAAVLLERCVAALLDRPDLGRRTA